MALKYYDRVRQVSITTGTGSYILGSSVTGFEDFSLVGNNNTCYYYATDGTDYEVGLGTFTTGPDTLSRDLILQSSNSNNAVSWTGDKTIALDVPASIVAKLESHKKEFQPTNTDDYTLSEVDFGKTVKSTESTATIITIPADIDYEFEVGTLIPIYQHGTGSVTVVGGSGVVLNIPTGFTGEMLGQYTFAFVQKTDDDEWVIGGSLTAS